MRSSSIIVATIALLITACDGAAEKKDSASGTARQAAEESPSSKKTGSEKGSATEGSQAANGAAAKPVSAGAAPDEPEPAVETVEGQFALKLGGQDVAFDNLEARSNYVLATNFGLLGSTSSGEQFQVMGVGLTIPTDGTFPMVLETEDPQEYMKRHKAHLAGKGPRTLQKRLSVMYTDAKGVRYLGSDTIKLTVSSFTGGKLAGTLSEGTFSGKKVDPIEFGGGQIEVQLMSPAAGRVVEKAVAGK
jgi:hypothetical protein